MANNYLKLSFLIDPTPAEAELLDECHELSTELEDVPEDEEHAHYSNRSDAFKATFPLVEDNDDPYHSFRSLFSDPDFPHFCCEIFGFLMEGRDFLIAGNEADPHAIASLIQKCAPSILPFGFEWSQSSDRLRPGEFGGGYFVVTADGIRGGGTSWLIDQEMKKLSQKGEG